MKYSLQHTKGRLNLATNSPKPVALGLGPGLAFTTILAQWCKYLDSMSFTKHRLKRRIMKRAITQHQQGLLRQKGAYL
jgi:hypothetical protein